MVVACNIHAFLRGESISPSRAENAVSASCPDTHHSHHSHNACDDCAVCKYSLSLFTEADSSDFILILPLVPYERVTYPEKIAYALSYSHYLRGPPVA